MQVLDDALWRRIEDFDLDQPLGNYCFSIRLAKEQKWTLDFTQRAVLEYKKFMYLAATSDHMVSPSEIVDQVWHQHLIFSRSYSDFCSVLGKEIQHIPSTHNRSEIKKFKAASERTKDLYFKHFGSEPCDIWDETSMHAALNLRKAKMKLRSFLLISTLSIILLGIPAFYLLYPVFTHWNNPGFLFFLIGVSAFVFIFFAFFNHWYLNNVFSAISQVPFIARLTPMEVIYLEIPYMNRIVHVLIDRMLKKGSIEILEDKSVQVINEESADRLDEKLVIEELKANNNKISFNDLIDKLAVKPQFTQIATSMSALKKYFFRSSAFFKLFMINYFFIAAIFTFGTLRLITGIVRDKPVGILIFLLLVILVVGAIQIFSLNDKIFSKILPKYFSKYPTVRQPTYGDEWDYFQKGSLAFSPLLIPLIITSSVNSDGGDGSSCGNSCGSSCGGGCGGCGGD